MLASAYLIAIVAPLVLTVAAVALRVVHFIHATDPGRPVLRPDLAPPVIVPSLLDDEVELFRAAPMASESEREPVHVPPPPPIFARERASEDADAAQPGPLHLVEADLPSTKICPDCAETILHSARVCRHCHFRFAPPLAGSAAV